jgi:hypothetical protein
MIDAQTATLLQGIIRREGRSLLQYVADAFPWLQGGEQDAWNQLRTLIQEERDAVAGLARFLIRHRITPPYLGAYAMSFTTFNFVSLDSLLPRLLGYQRRGIATLERELERITEPDPRVEVHRFLEMKQRHLNVLEALPGVPREPAPA